MKKTQIKTTKTTGSSSSSNNKAASETVSASSTPIASSSYEDEYAGFPHLNANTKSSAASTSTNNKQQQQQEFKIDSIDASSLTPDEFYSRYISTRTPVLLRNASGIGEFHSLRDRWLSRSYLQRQAGEAKVRVEWKDRNAQTSFGRGQHVWMNFSQFLDHMTADDKDATASTSPHENHALYLTSQPIDQIESTGAPMELCAEPISSLLPDMPLRPSLLQSLTPVQYNCWIGRYRDSTTTNQSKQSTTNAAAAAAAAAAASTATSFTAPSHFYRSPGTTSGLHHDYHDNIYYLLSGLKHFHLYPPNQAPFMYCHGMKKTQHQDGDEDEDDDNSGSKKKNKKNASTSEPLCVIHNNGVIEYTTKSAASNSHKESQGNEETNKQDSKHKNKNKLDAREKKLQQMMEEDLKEEEEEDEEEEEEDEEEDEADDAASTASNQADAENEELIALAKSKHLALSNQLSELSALHTKAKLQLKFEMRDSKKFKHLTNEEKGLNNKIQQLHMKIEKIQSEERARLEQFNKDKQKGSKVSAAASSKSSSKRAVAAEEDDEQDEEDDDDDEGSFPDEDALAAMQDDYEASDDDEAADAIAMDDDEDGEDDEDEDEGGFGDAMDDDDDDDDDDDEIDPAEKAAWEAFMKESQARANKKKQSTQSGASTTEKSSANSKKRKLDSSTPSAAAEAQLQKKSKSSASAPSSTTTASSSIAIPLKPHEEVYPSNFSRIDFVRKTSQQIQNEFPLFVQKCCKPLVLKVKPSDMLYLPASWFHEVFSSNDSTSQKDSSSSSSDRLDSNVHFALNYWFAPPSKTGTQPHKPYTTATDRAFEEEYQSYYRPRVEALREIAQKRQKIHVKPQQQKQKQQQQQNNNTNTNNKTKTNAAASKPTKQQSAPSKKK